MKEKIDLEILVMDLREKGWTMNAIDYICDAIKSFQIYTDLHNSLSEDEVSDQDEMRADKDFLADLSYREWKENERSIN